MIRQLSIAVILITVVSVLAADEQADTAFYPHNVGAGAGISTGLGLSYRHWFINAFGLQANLIPVISSAGDEQNIFISVGLTGMKILKQGRVVNLFGYIGVHGLYRNWETEYNNDSEREAIITREKEKTGYVGLGPGFDIHFWKLSVNLMAGIAGRFNDEGDWGIQMSGETALYYTF